MAKRPLKTVPLHGKAGGTTKVEEGATYGATIGVNVFNRDGTIWNGAAPAAPAPAPPPGGVIREVSITAWPLIQSVPPNVQQLAESVTGGYLVLQAGGNILPRSITGTAGEIESTNPAGEAGNTILNLADVADGGGGALLKIARDGKGRVEGTSAPVLADFVAFGVQPGIDFQDEGVSVAAIIDTVDFTGSGVTATESGGVLTVDIPGGAGGSTLIGGSWTVFSLTDAESFGAHGDVSFDTGGSGLRIGISIIDGNTTNFSTALAQDLIGSMLRVSLRGSDSPYALYKVESAVGDVQPSPVVFYYLFELQPLAQNGTFSLSDVLDIAFLGSRSVAGSDTQVQFNDGGVVGAEASFTFNKATNTLGLGSGSATDVLIAMDTTAGVAGVEAVGSGADGALNLNAPGPGSVNAAMSNAATLASWEVSVFSPLDFRGIRVLSTGSAPQYYDGSVWRTVYHSGNLPAASVSDGDKGDITVSSSGTVWNIDAGVVTTTELGGDITAAGKALLDDADATAQRATLGLVIGTNVQAYDATLAALAGANWAANNLPIGSGADTVAQVSFAANTFPARASTGDLSAKAVTDFALTLLDDTDAATMRATLGVPAGITDGDKGDVIVSSSGTVWTFDLGVAHTWTATQSFANTVIGGSMRFTGVTGADRIDFEGGPGTGGMTYKDSGGAQRTMLQNPAADTVAVSNRASNGVVQIRGNTSTAGAGGETVLATFSVAAGLELTGPLAGSGVQGTSFPGSPATGRRFFRTDRGLEYFYDGTRWLSVQQFREPLVVSNTLMPYSASATGARLRINGAEGIWLEKWVALTRVSTTNNGTNRWDFVLNYTAANNADTLVSSFSTGTVPDTVGNQVDHDQTINAVLNSAATMLYVAITKVLSPGNLVCSFGVVYRLIG